MKRRGRTHKPDAWMPLFIADYLADTGKLTTEGHGAYMLLIMEYWRGNGPLADDDVELAAVCRMSVERWTELRRTLAKFFAITDGMWRHKRIDEELAIAWENHATAQKRAEAGNAAKNSNKAPSRNLQGNDGGTTKGPTSPSPSPSPDGDIPKASPSGDAAPLRPIDLNAEMWRTGAHFLKTTGGKSDADARKLIGQWRKRFSEVDLIAAFASAEAKGTADPIGYITAILQGRGRDGNDGRTARQRELDERRAEQADAFRVAVGGGMEPGGRA